MAMTYDARKEKINYDEWEYDPESGEFFLIVSRQPSGNQVEKQWTYARRLEYRIAQEADTTRAGEGVYSGLCLFGTVLIAYPFHQSPIALGISAIAGLALAIYMITDKSHYVKVGPPPCKVFDVDAMKRQQAEMQVKTQSKPLKTEPIEREID